MSDNPAHSRTDAERTGRARSRKVAAVAAAGVALVAMAIVVELADAGGPPQFGAGQLVGLVIGMLLVGGVVALALLPLIPTGRVHARALRLAGVTLGCGGLVLLTVGFLPDAAGSEGYGGLGWKQAVAIALGAAAVAASAMFGWASRNSEENPSAPEGSPAKRAGRRGYAKVVSTARQHRGLVVLLALAALLRIAFSVAYWPVLFFSDSADYIGMTDSAFPVGFATSGHPSGYPLVIDIVSVGLSSLGAIAVFQHIVGLVSGVLVYALALRLRAPRWAALVAAALVLFDAHLLAFEQHVGTESLFVLLLIATCFLLVGRVTVSRAAVTGLLLALATTMRTAALFAVPVWLIYLLVDKNRLRLVGPALGAFVAPLLVYGLLHGLATGWYGLGESGGWLLYGRTAEIADCEDAKVPPSTRPLCGAAQRKPLDNPLSYVWTDDSPPRKLFGEMWQGSTERRQQVNDDLQDFAIAAIRDHPIAYAKMIADDLAEVVLLPGDAATPPAALPDRSWGQFGVASLQKSHFPDYVPPSRFPASLLLSYQQWAYVPGLLAAVLAVLALAVASVNLVKRRNTHDARAVLLLVGVGLAVFIGSVAASNGDLRYLLTSIPLLVIAGTVAGSDLGRYARRRVEPASDRRAPSTVASPSTER